MDTNAILAERYTNEYYGVLGELTAIGERLEDAWKPGRVSPEQYATLRQLRLALNALYEGFDLPARSTR